ncbi:uncharacterized protein LOC120112008 [Phoenix dactylifera]|uniref:Uncharacterized protein LOC120112008 n=1 Tax=Phoenix dactylifera TaxID=42345 RepID=A0A8B9AJJ8_PHODC|nr:uncharacterized protein LOC120112008 [Phoenix dactylifera]
MEPDSMWSSLMRAKYGALVPGVRAARHHSLVWREMCARAGVVLSKIRWAIGDGRSIDVLEDCWVTAVPISRMPTMVDSVRLTGQRVSDLLDPDEGGWREGLLREVFGVQLAEMILGLPVPFQGESDRLVGAPSGRSQVRARDLHALFSREPARRIEGGWIWRMQIHPRVALFIWKVAWGCLPTRSMLVRRGMWVPQGCEGHLGYPQCCFSVQVCRCFLDTPTLGYLKVNFDGSVATDRRLGGVGFVIRDHFGSLVAAGGRGSTGLTVAGAEL